MANNILQERVEFLKGISIFKDISEDSLLSFAGLLVEKSYGLDEPIFKIGDRTEGLYLVKSGSVRIHSNTYDYSIISKGGFFGEYALIDENQRSLDATAVLPSCVFIINNEDFYKFIVVEPALIKGLLKNLIKRMRKRNVLEEIMVNKSIEISNQKLLFEQKSDRLQEIIDTKDKLFSIIAHDLKNPFSMIMVLTELLIDNPDFDIEKVKQYMKHINSSAKDIYHLLENLLQWARTQTNSIKIEKKKLQVAEVVEENLVLFKNIFDEKNLSFEILINQKTVFADYTTFNTIIRNLISNAAKFSNVGDSISFVSYLNEDKCIITISDNGIGMNQFEIEKLFKPGNSMKRGTKDEKGSGLGLLIVKEFVELNNGSISVSSTLGEGSAFTISIPAYEYL